MLFQAFRDIKLQSKIDVAIKHFTGSRGFYFPQKTETRILTMWQNGMLIIFLNDWASSLINWKHLITT